MDSDSFVRRKSLPLVWLIVVISAAMVSGWCYAGGKYLWCVLGADISLSSAYFLIKEVRSAARKVKYIMDATINGDFSFRFPTENVSADSYQTNKVLNRMVEHLENLTDEVRQKESFLSQVINIVDTGIVICRHIIK